MRKGLIYDKGLRTGKALEQVLNSLLLNQYSTTESIEELNDAVITGGLDSIIMVAPDSETVRQGVRISRKSVDNPLLIVTIPGNDAQDAAEESNVEYASSLSLADIVSKVKNHRGINPILTQDYGFAFEADPKGLTQVLMDQFSEPLLCFREIVQNSVDANANRIDIQTGYDPSNNLLSVSVKDDGEGMTLDHIRTYLTLFDSTKDTDIKKIGQMGAGKVFAHALKPQQMIVETGDGVEGHRVVFNPDMSGSLLSTEPYSGTDIKLALPLSRGKARKFNTKLGEVVSDWCKYIRTPLFVNGEKINEPFELRGSYVERIQDEGLDAILKLSDSGGDRYKLLKGGIKLEDTCAPYVKYENGDILGLFNGLIDAESFDFPISRNGVVENREYERIFDDIRSGAIGKFTPRLLEDSINDQVLTQHQLIVRNFFYHILANHGYREINTETLERIRELSILDNADGRKISVAEVEDKAKDHNKLYFTNNDLSNTELSAFLDKGIPVLRNPSHLVTENIFEDLAKQSLDERYYRGESFRELGAFDFYAIRNLLNKDFVQKVSAGSFSGGGFTGVDINKDGTFDNPFNFRDLQIYGADFKDLQGNPEEKVLLDTYYDRDRIVIFNVNHPFMREMGDLAEHNSRLSQYYTACELIKSKNVFPSVSYKMREHEMSRIGLKVLDNE